MAANLPSPRIGIYGSDRITANESRGCYLWPPGYAAAITAAGGEPVAVELPRAGESWESVWSSVDGILFLGQEGVPARQAALETRLCDTCRKREIPFLGVDRGLHVLNGAFGGTLFVDLPKEQPQALQHRHPPEKGLRHAILVEPGTRIERIYGEGEIVVNSEHRQAVARVGRGFRVSARALDGIVEAIEAESESWFAVGVQWQPASNSASGLDIQLFRGLIEACQRVGAELEVGAAA
jgi:putative glutamine amidotransferase